MIVTVTGDQAALNANFHNGIEGHPVINKILSWIRKAKRDWFGFEEDARSFMQSCFVCHYLSSTLCLSYGSNFLVDFLGLIK